MRHENTHYEVINEWIADYTRLKDDKDRTFFDRHESGRAALILKMLKREIEEREKKQ